VLREVSEPVEEIDQEAKDLVSDMTDTLKKARGLGLAAVQIGVLKQVFVLDLTAVDVNESLRVYINPEIVNRDGSVELEEGCLSFPGIYQKIVRPAKVTVQATDLDGNRFEQTLDGLAARAVLHEFDHLEGRLFIDYLSPINRTLLKSRLKRLAAAS
jgi:peptide deformylase